MKYIYSLCRLRYRRTVRVALIICILWVTGLLFGRFCATAAQTSSLQVMRISARTKPIFIIQLFGQLLPLVMTILVVRFGFDAMLRVVVILHGFFFGYIAYLTVLTFCTAGWLVYRILLFAECINSMILLWAWVNAIIEKGSLTAKRLYFCTGAICLVTLFDYFICSGFLMSVLT